MSLSNIRHEVYDRVSRSQYYRDNFAGLTAHQRHQKLLSQLPGELQPAATTAAAAAVSNTVTDEDVLRQHHRFLRGPDDDADASSNWGARLAKRYYDRLFKEFAIADLSRFRESKLGLRWRTKAEVVSGKGQFVCGAKGCSQDQDLASFEVNFAYQEAGQPKAALVKLRLCGDCAHKLNYKKERQYRKLGLSVLEQQEQQEPPRADVQKRWHKRRDRHRPDSSDDGSGSSDGSRGQQHLGSRRRKRARAGAAAAADPHSAAEEEGTGAATAAAPASNAALTDADIDTWLDNIFTATGRA